MGFDGAAVMGASCSPDSNVVLPIEPAHCPSGQVGSALPYPTSANHMKGALFPSVPAMLDIGPIRILDPDGEVAPPARPLPRSSASSRRPTESPGASARA